MIPTISGDAVPEVEQTTESNGAPDMNIQNSPNLAFHQTALNLRAQRQELLASNIANADTPNYKARDVNFKDALHGALAGRVGQPLALSASSSRHLGGQSVAAPAGVLYRPEQQASVDGNTVDMDVERASFAANALQYEASITFINGMLRTMQTAIQGQ